MNACRRYLAATSSICKTTADKFLLRERQMG